MICQEFRQASADLKRRFYEESDRLKKSLSDSLEHAKLKVLTLKVAAFGL